MLKEVIYKIDYREEATLAEKCQVIVITKEINLTQSKRLLKVKIRLRLRNALAIIDFRVTSDFIILEEAERLKLITKPILREECYQLNTINRSSISQGQVCKQTILTFLALGLYIEVCVFDIIKIENQTVVLRKLQLVDHNLDINQTIGKIMISCCLEKCDFLLTKKKKNKKRIAYIAQIDSKTVQKAELRQIL